MISRGSCVFAFMLSYELDSMVLSSAIQIDDKNCDAINRLFSLLKRYVVIRNKSLFEAGVPAGCYPFHPKATFFLRKVLRSFNGWITMHGCVNFVL